MSDWYTGPQGRVVFDIDNEQEAGVVDEYDDDRVQVDRQGG